MAYSRMGAADASSLSEDEIDRAIRAGQLRAKRKGRRVLVLREDLHAFLVALDDVEPV